jgi:hypothetical protein
VRFHSRHNRLKGDRRQPRCVTLAAIPILEKQGMLSRALSFATVALLVGCFAAGSAHAQATNLEAGKTPSQIFSGTCTVCHKSPRGLLKTVPASSLPGFLRQHYTTSSDMASVLASFLVSNGATDTRYQAKDAPKQDPGKQDPGKKPDAKQEANTKPDARPEQLDRFGRKLHPSAPAQEAAKPDAAKPDADGLAPQGEGAKPGRDAKRLARPGQPPDGARPEDGQTPVQAATDSKSGGKQKLGKRGKPGEEPKTDEAKGNAAKDDAGKSETAKTDAGKTEDKPESAKEATKPAGEGKPEAAKSETAKGDAPKESGGEPKPLRPDPVPAVTPAPAGGSATTASGTPEPAASPAAPAPVAAPMPAPAAVTASAPPSPAAPAGPPAPPISQ